MATVFVLGLITLFGIYCFATGYSRALLGIQETWGGLGLVIGWLPPIQWLWALENPFKAAPSLLRQLAGVAMCTPGAMGLVWIWLFRDGFRIG